MPLSFCTILDGRRKCFIVDRIPYGSASSSNLSRPHFFTSILRAAFLILAVLLPPLVLYAQTTIRGQVLDSITQTAVKVELMATHHDRYTEVRYEYTDTLQGASPMLTLGRLRVRSNPKGYEIQTDTRLTNHRFVRGPVQTEVQPVVTHIYEIDT